MPTYAYACTECGHAFDAVQKFTDDALTTCPECGGRLRKVYGSIGVSFKGSGFYRNDSRAASGTGGASSEPRSDAGKKDGATSDGGTKDAKKDGAKKDAGSAASTPSAPASSTSSSSSSGTAAAS